MEQLGISPIKATTLPGFEWALGENRFLPLLRGCP